MWPEHHEGKNANYFTADDCISVGVYAGKEDREKLEIVFPELMKQIHSLSQTGLTVDDKQFELEFIFCSDWKFLALLLGLKNANSIWFCPWCLCSKEYRQALNLKWHEYLRTWGEDCICLDCARPDVKCQDPSHGRNPYCTPLLTAPFTPSSCVLDNFHGELRTSEIMEKGLFNIVDQNNLSEKLEDMCKDASMSYLILFYIQSLT